MKYYKLFLDIFQSKKIMLQRINHVFAESQQILTDDIIEDIEILEKNTIKKKQKNTSH